MQFPSAPMGQQRNLTSRDNMNFFSVVAVVIAASVLAASPVFAAVKMSRQYDNDYKSKTYHFTCYMKDKNLEVCGNWKVFK